MLQGKRIMVTGAGSGNSQTCAVADRDGHFGQAVAAAICDAGGEARLRECDVTDEASVASVVAFTVETYGRLDGAMNNTGIETRNKPVHELTADDINTVLGVDPVSVFCPSSDGVDAPRRHLCVKVAVAHHIIKWTMG